MEESHGEATGVDYKRIIDAVSEDVPLLIVGLDGRPYSFKDGPQKIAVLDSSFNPPTLAHAGILRVASEAVAFDVKVLMLGTTNADKHIVGAQLHERLAMMQHMGAATGGAAPVTLAVTCFKLFVDKARTIIEMMSEDVSSPLSVVYFIVGSDTIIRIFDPKYYKDPAVELGELFRMAHLISIDRDEASIQKTAEVLNTPLGHMFKDRITLLKIDDPELQSISSTRVREALQSEESLSSLLLPGVEEFVRNNAHMYAAL